MDLPFGLRDPTEGDQLLLRSLSTFLSLLRDLWPKALLPLRGRAPETSAKSNRSGITRVVCSLLAKF